MPRVIPRSGDTPETTSYRAQKPPGKRVKLGVRDAVAANDRRAGELARRMGISAPIRHRGMQFDVKSNRAAS